MGSVKHGAAGGQGDVQRPHHWPASSTAYHNAAYKHKYIPSLLVEISTSIVKNQTNENTHLILFFLF